jgi:hypothetical protein
VSALRLVVEFDPTGLSPRAVRSAFAEALRDVIAKGRISGEVDPAIAEELWRAVPRPEQE